MGCPGRRLGEQHAAGLVCVHARVCDFTPSHIPLTVTKLRWNQAKRLAGKEEVPGASGEIRTSLR